MIIIGIILCVISIFIIYKRLVYIFLGHSAKGIIIGYGNPIKSYNGIESYPYKVKYKYNGIESYPYKVKYKYNGKEYIGYSLESESVSYGNFPNKNLHREITIYFKKDKPEVVTIKEFNSTLIIGIIFLLLGILSIILQL